MIPDDLKYARTHEWARLQGDVVSTGITAFAVEQLGDIVYLDLPRPGTRTTQGQPMGAIESVKAAVDLYAPVSGEVFEFNQALSSDFDVLKQDPYDRGWMVRIRVADPSALAGLLGAEEYRKLLDEEPKH